MNYFKSFFTLNYQEHMFPSPKHAGLMALIVDHGCPTFYDKGPHPFVVGWFAGRSWKNNK